MSAFAYFFSASNIGAGLICLALGTYVIAKSRSQLNWSYCRLTAALFLNALTLSIFWLAADPAMIGFWYLVSAACRLMVFAAIFALCLEFAEIKAKYIRWAYLLFPLFYMTVVLGPHYISGFDQALYGNRFLPGPAYPLFPFFYLSFMAVSLLLVYRVYKQSPFFYRRKQASPILEC